MRVRKKPWAETELKTNARVVQEPEQNKGQWHRFFQNENPIFLEIGCGKGQFLSQNASAYPEYNYIGIERQPSVLAVAARKAQGDNRNLAFFCADAAKLVDYFSVGEIKRLYINFCDPWPKKRCAKRRLTYRGFLRGYRELMGAGAEVFFKTDNERLFEFSLNEFCDDGWRLSAISLDLHRECPPDNICTEYEEKFSQKGMPIFRLEARYS